MVDEKGGHLGRRRYQKLKTTSLPTLRFGSSAAAQPFGRSAPYGLVALEDQT